MTGSGDLLGATADSTVTLYIDTGLAPGTTYYYQINARTTESNAAD